MKTLFNNIKYIFLGLFLFITSISLMVSLFIKGVLMLTDSKTHFFSIFLPIFGILLFVLFILTLFKFFMSKEEVEKYSEKWNLPFNDVAEGIYDYEIQNYWMLNAGQFSEILKEARYKSKMLNKGSYG